MKKAIFIGHSKNIIKNNSPLKKYIHDEGYFETMLHAKKFLDDHKLDCNCIIVNQDDLYCCYDPKRSQQTLVIDKPVVLYCESSVKKKAQKIHTLGIYDILEPYHEKDDFLKSFFNKLDQSELSEEDIIQSVCYLKLK